MSCCGKKLVDKGKNIIKGHALLAADTIGALPKEKYAYRHERLRTCRECEKHKFILKRLWCDECGCHLPAKAFVKEEKCPLDKWRR